MQVNKSDIMKFFDKREEELRKRIDEEKISAFQNIESSRLQECLFIKEMVSIIWDIIHQKKG